MLNCLFLTLVEQISDYLWTIRNLTLRLIAILSTNIRDMTGIKKMTGSQDISVKTDRKRRELFIEQTVYHSR